ncbi:MAG: enoyl-CoA hydratase/isomerase family protein [Myxococcales bacterium]|nr:enoyl-CoA hydratase/isomerase family protein [Myxococcales bacterium]
MADTAAVVKCTASAGVVTLTLDRPARRNALSAELITALRAALAAADADREARAIVITGAGDRAFCAGGDLAGGMTGGGEGFPARIAEKGLFAELITDLRGLGKPVVARVGGDAFGGGVGLMLACDLVIAADDVRIGLPEIEVGLWPMMVTTLLVRHVGPKTALELMMLGEKHTAAAAQAMGLVNRVVPREALDAEVARVAGKLAARSPAVLAMGRRAFYETADLPVEAALPVLRDRLVLNTLLEDAAEGVMAFMAKRDPQWKGR